MFSQRFVLFTSLIVFSLVIVLGGIASFLREQQKFTAAQLQSAVAHEDEGIPTSSVIVALKSIPAGSQFGAGSLGRRDWPANNIPPDTIDDESQTIGKIAKTDIVQGQVIIERLLANPNDAASQPDAIVQPVVSYLTQPQAERVIIYTGQIWLIVADTSEAVQAVTKLAEEFGGYVSETNTYQTSNNVLQGSITIRVVSTRYQEALAQLRNLAIQVQREESRSQDVTEEFTDHEARLANLQSGESAIQRLLDTEAAADDIGQMAEVQQQLAEIRADIEEVEGRLRYLTDQASLSTIQVELIPETAPPTPTPTPTPIPGWAPQSVATDASQSLVYALQRTVNAVIWGIIFGVPVLLVYFIPFGILVWFVRRIWQRQKST